MARGMDLEQLRDELVDACAWGEEARARALLSSPGTQPRKVRALLEAMLRESEAQVRQAAAFALGELGGAAAVRLLEQQLAREEARGDYDGEAVAEAITAALGRIEEAGARAALVRKLERLATGRPQPGEVNSLANALWRRRHPALLPSIQQSLERLEDPRVSCFLHGLRVLLEKAPGELGTWARDPAVPLVHKTSVLTVLEADLPGALLAALPAFISEAHALLELAVSGEGEASYYCERLLSLLLSYREHLSALPEQARAELRAVARRLVASVAPNCSARATLLLQLL